MIYNRFTNTAPLIAHGPGKLEFLPLWPIVLQSSLLFPPRSELIPELTVITFNSGVDGYNNKSLGVFERSVELAGLTCEVLGRGVKNWENKIKISLLDAFLKTVGTEYVLVSDSSDVVLVRPLKELIARFEKMNCDALFNAEKQMWPLDIPQDMCDLEQTRHAGCYLNAGLWIARTAYAREILTQVRSVKAATMHLKSEQAFYKYCYRDMYPRFKVDIGCSIFQGLNRVDEKEVQIVGML